MAHLFHEEVTVPSLGSAVMAGHFAFLSFGAKGDKRILDPAWDGWRGPGVEEGGRKLEEMESEE